MAIGTALAIGAAVGGSMLAKSSANKAAKKATNAQVQSQQMAIDAQKEMFNQNKAMLSPFVDGGRPAMGQINALLGLSGADAQTGAFDAFRNSSAYKFGMDQALDATRAGYAGIGAMRSGAAMKGIADRAQGFADSSIYNYMNALGNQQNLGAQSASALAGVGTQFANSIGNSYVAQGDARANGALAKGANNAQFFNSLANLGGSIFGGGM